MFRGFGVLSFLSLRLLSLRTRFRFMSVLITIVARANLALMIDQTGVSVDSDTCGDCGMKLYFNFDRTSVHVSKQHWADSFHFSILGEEFFNTFGWKTILEMGNC